MHNPSALAPLAISHAKKKEWTTVWRQKTNGTQGGQIQARLFHHLGLVGSGGEKREIRTFNVTKEESKNKGKNLGKRKKTGE